MDRVVEGEVEKDYPKPEKEKRIAIDIEKKLMLTLLLFRRWRAVLFLTNWMDLNATKGPVYPHAILMPAGDTEEVRHLALFSKIPISSVRMHHDLSYPYFGDRQTPDRGVLEVDADSNGTEVETYQSAFEEQMDGEKR